MKNPVKNHSLLLLLNQKTKNDTNVDHYPKKQTKFEKNVQDLILSNDSITIVTIVAREKIKLLVMEDTTLILLDISNNIETSTIKIIVIPILNFLI